MNNNTHNSPEQKPGKKIAYFVFIALIIAGLIFSFTMMDRQYNPPADPGNDPGQVEPGQTEDPKQPEGPDKSDPDYTENGVKVHKPWENSADAKYTSSSKTGSSGSAELTLIAYPGMPGGQGYYIHPGAVTTDGRIDVADSSLIVIPFVLTARNKSDFAQDIELRFNALRDYATVYVTEYGQATPKTIGTGPAYYTQNGVTSMNSLRIIGYVTLPNTTIADMTDDGKMNNPLGSTYLTMKDGKITVQENVFYSPVLSRDGERIVLGN